ncbi:Hypothetical protein BSSP2_I1193 [Brucella suis bv. 2]|nr:Hypothetical protein BSSP3_I1191 [Brucella suis bv. 2]AIB20637.1 Hypothetical protein BSPT1_I0535 [Brucella suis bv. 2]AIB23997.1 Hypothetical protein BSPT2_I0525 [Brucella suis bv. 2]AIB27390.1 Hypothetical protein BSSP1_I0525 [Brucella suis bv. 2]AIB31410.1 Hypothetical protein BSSP2_I1193 [Brucella suis bv. 2]
MHLFGHEARRALFRKAKINPCREIFDTVAADAKFDEI